MTVLESTVVLDDFTSKACEPFDYKFDGTTRFTLPEFTPPTDFTLGLIVGPSGSGKSQLLRQHFGTPDVLQWDGTKAIVSQVSGTPEDAVARLSAVGLNSVPSWCKPRHVLSNGEGFRADLAKCLRTGAVIDEFTSVIDRNVAKAASVGLRRFVDRYKLTNVVVATCHYDIVEWLQPDWVFDTATGVITPRGSLQPRPKIELSIEPCDRKVWPIFAPHHYLTEKLSNASHCWAAWWGDTLVGFASTISFPHGSIKNARREHRTVILPDFQGLGIGVRLSDAIADLNVRVMGKRYYSKTAHPRMGEYRDRHPNWHQTSASRITDPRARHGTKVKSGLGIDYAATYHRMCWSHEWKQEAKTEFGGGA
jgi:hypothetical protein